MRGVRVLRAQSSVFNLVRDLLFDCSRILKYAKIRTVLQSKSIVESAILASLVTRHFNLGVPVITVKNYTSYGNN